MTYIVSGGALNSTHSLMCQRTEVTLIVIIYLIEFDKHSSIDTLSPPDLVVLE